MITGATQNSYRVPWQGQCSLAAAGREAQAGLGWSAVSEMSIVLVWRLTHLLRGMHYLPGFLCLAHLRQLLQIPGVVAVPCCVYYLNFLLLLGTKTKVVDIATTSAHKTSDNFKWP